MKLTTDYLIVGSGPSALLHNFFLKSSGQNSLHICSGLFGQLKPKIFEKLNGKPVNILPIFPVTGSPLWNLIKNDLPPCPQLSLHKLNANGESLTQKYKSASYASFLNHQNQSSSIPLTLSYKQFGDLVFSLPLHELRDKLKRNYKAGSPVFTKPGFIDGLSPYYLFLKKNSPYSILGHQIKHIDLINKKVYTNHGEVQYNTMIFTQQYQHIFKYTHLKNNVEMTGGDAKFVTFYSPVPLPENHLWYDCNPHSNIYRVFVPHPHIITAQLARKSWTVSQSAIGSEIEKLLNLKHKIEHECTDTYHNCYPLDVSDRTEKQKLISYLAGHNVFLSGRFATWRYIDLHEVDYMFRSQSAKQTGKIDF